MPPLCHGLVAAFAAPTDLLILDEPTSGLDPLMEQVFNECLAEHKAAGTTVLLSSHVLAEVAQTVDEPGDVAEEMRHLIEALS